MNGKVKVTNKFQIKNFAKSGVKQYSKKITTPGESINQLKKRIDRLEEVFPGVITWVGLNGHVNLNQANISLGKGVANGLVPLDATTRIDPVYLPFSTVRIIGGWNAAINVPDLGALVPGVDVLPGYAYIVTENGDGNDLIPGVYWEVGEVALYTEAGWVQVGDEEAQAECSASLVANSFEELSRTEAAAPVASTTCCAINGTHLFVSFGLVDGYILHYDVSDKYNPALLNTYTYVGTPISVIRILENAMYACSNNGRLLIFDVSNINAPVLVSNTNLLLGNVIDLVIDEDNQNFIHIASLSAGFITVNVTNPVLPVVVFNDVYVCTGISYNDSMVFTLNNSIQDIMIYDVQDRLAIVLDSQQNLGVAMRGLKIDYIKKIASIGGFGTTDFYIVDISDLALINIISTISQPIGEEGSFVDNSVIRGINLFTFNQNGIVNIYDIQNVYAPSLILSRDITGVIGSGIVTIDNFMFLTISNTHSFTVSSIYSFLIANGTFLSLIDTPNNYITQSRKLVMVNELETALEFQDAIPNVLTVVESGNGGMYTTISAAIADAVAGDVILIYQGTYTENITINKSINIVGISSGVILNGSIDFVSAATVVSCVISNMTIASSDTHAIYSYPALATSTLELRNVHLTTLWGNDPTQVEGLTAKSVVKIDSGNLIINSNSSVSIFSSGNNSIDIITSSYWLTDSGLASLNVSASTHIVQNNTDAKQTLVLVFNSNTNAGTIVKFKDNVCSFYGMPDYDNMVMPFRTLDSCVVSYVDNNIIKVYDSLVFITCYHENLTPKSTLNNNSIFLYVGILDSIYLASNGSADPANEIKMFNNYFNINEMPILAPNDRVDYFITLANGATYYSKGKTGLLLTVTDADYTIRDDDGVYSVAVSTGAFNRTITLPTAADNKDRVINFKKIDSGIGAVIIDGEGAETIDDALTINITNQYDAYTIQSDGSNWWIRENIVNNFIPTIPNVITVSEGGVGANYASIQDAIDAADPEDVILVHQGTYIENLVINKTLYIEGDSRGVIINGQIEFISAGTVVSCVISSITVVSVDNHAVWSHPALTNSTLELRNVNLSVLWGVDATQVPNVTAKSVVKIDSGNVIINTNSSVIIYSSGNDLLGITTAAYWVSEATLASLNVCSTNHLVSNETDPNQTLSLIFNTNNNINTIVKFKDNINQIIGLTIPNNFIIPFILSGSNTASFIDDNIIKAYNSDTFISCFHNLATPKSVLTNNSFFLFNFTGTSNYLADNSLSDPGNEVKIFNNYFNLDVMPLILGSVEYFITLANGATYYSKGKTGLLLTVTDANYTVLDNDGVYTILVSTGAANRTITLPIAANNNNRIISIKKIDVGVGEVHLTPEGASQIDTIAAALIIAAQFDCYTLHCDGANWWII